MPLINQTDTFVLDTAKLDEMIANNPYKIANEVTKFCNRVLTDARMVTPRDPARPPQHPEAYAPSGELRANSDVVKVDSKGLTQRIEYYQEYAAAQELGNPAQNLPARPYLTPAFEKNVEKFIDDITLIISGTDTTAISWLGGMGE